MLLEIRLTNFFSIKDEIVLDMRAANINTISTKKLTDNCFEVNKQKLLKTVVMYGANASGKSNIIKAIRFCNAMIFESHQHNENTRYNFQPFKFAGYNNKPSHYFIRFISDDIEYEYSFSLTRTKIIKESLYYYPHGRRAKVFIRNEQKGPEKDNIYSFGSAIKKPMDVAYNTSNKTLYISRASQMDRTLAKNVFNYFHQKFILRYWEYSQASIDHLFHDNKKKILEALQQADSDIVDIKINKHQQKGKHYDANLTDLTLSVKDVIEEQLQIKSYHKVNKNIPFDFIREESDGTRKLFFIILTILHIIENDKILLIDEIGESLHHYIIQYIFDLFKASKQSQLICTTHHTAFLDLKTFRKDQIYFVDKKDDASTDLYSLYDYKDFRETMNLETAYLQGRFGAIPHISHSKEKLISTE